MDKKFNIPVITYPHTESDEKADLEADSAARWGKWEEHLEDGPEDGFYDIWKTSDFETLDQLGNYQDDKLVRSLWDNGFPRAVIDGILGRDD